MSENQDHYAIVIGIDQYPLLRNLPTAVRSAMSFGDWLTSPEGGDLTPNNMRMILSPSDPILSPLDARPVAYQIDYALSQLGLVAPGFVGKRLYFYFAGMACGTSLDDLSMLMAGASLDDLSHNIGLKPYRQFLCQNTSFEEIVYVLDCEFLEHPPVAPGGPGLATASNPRVTSVKEFILMSSPRIRQLVQSDGVVVEATHGSLTKAVIEGLSGAAATSERELTAPKNLKSRITALSLADYVRARVRDLATGPKLLQLPEMLLPNEEIVFTSVAVSLLTGKLIVQVPHWSAEVRIFNSLFQLMAGPLEIKASPAAAGVYEAETQLPEGIYRVDATLEGQTESQHVAVQFKQTSTIEKDSWKTLSFLSAAPLEGTATTHEWHMGPAIEWSSKVTWKHSPGGDKRTSRLFLFVRTTHPDRHKMYAEGLKLLDVGGKVITDFSSGIKKDAQYGWMAFCADLEPGCYILRRARAGVRLRQQPVYLCDGWETQVFLQAKNSPSLRTQSINMALLGKGFHPDDETAIAAEAVLDSMRYGGSNKELVTKEKLSLLLRGKFENPWLGILSAYALRSQIDEQSGAPNQEAQDLLAHVMSYLDQVGSHPDVRALKLKMDESSPEPFPYPPLLTQGLRLVQYHSTKFSQTIPPGSLTDLVTNNLVADSPWTAWRHIESSPATWEIDPALIESGKQLARIFTGKVLTHAASLLQSAAPKAPVLRIADIMTGTGKQLATSKASVQDIASFAILDIIQGLMQESDLDALPETITLNPEKQINHLLQDVKAEDISDASGLSLAHTENSLRNLRERGTQPATSAISAQEPELSVTDRVVLEYALSESAKQGGSGMQAESAETKPEDSEPHNADNEEATAVDLPSGNRPSVTIEDCVAAIRGEAARILPRPGDAIEDIPAETLTQAMNFAGRLRKVADNLLERAAFTATTASRGRILYSNRAFISLITPADDSLTPDERNRIQNANQKVWEKLLANAPIGHSTLVNPLAGVSPKEFRLSRIAIKDEESKKPNAYLNSMRGKDAVAVRQETLEEINQLLPDLTRYASFFSYDLGQGRKEHALKLEEITQKLEGIIDDSGKASLTLSHAG